MARFDRAVPPGGEGKISLKLTLNGYKGAVRKTSTVETDDPKNPSVVLIMEGTVRSLIDVAPSTSVYFRGPLEEIKPQTIEFTGTSLPFHIARVESNLEGKVRHDVQTVEEGKRYRLLVVNELRMGTYGGFIKLYTDLAQKSEIVVRVNGSIEGEVRVSPASLLVGRLRDQEAERTGKVQVVSTRSKPFRITRLDCDERLVRLAQHEIPGGAGYVVEVIPRLDHVQAGMTEETTLTIQTDLSRDEQVEIRIQVVNLPTDGGGSVSVHQK